MPKEHEVLLRVPSIVDVNAVIWISSLAEAEMRPTERAHDDLLPYLHAKNILFRFYEPKSASEFVAIFEQLAVEAQGGLLPIIVIDSHGADRGLVIEETREVISWMRFAELLRPINIATKNNLCVLSAACYGFQSIFEAGVLEPVPYFILIGAEKKFYFFEKEIVAFFKDVFDNDDIVAAHRRTLSSQTRLFHCEGALLRALITYIRNHCVGSGLRRRKESLLSEAVKQGLPNTRFERRRARRLATQMIRPTQTLIDRFVSVFLIGKQTKLSIIDVMKLVRLRIKAEEQHGAAGRRRLTTPSVERPNRIL